MNFLKKKGDTVAAYQRVFSSKEGELVLADLAKVCHLDQPTFAPDNQYVTAFREGERSILLRILRTIKTDPAKVMELLAGQSGE